VIFRELRRAVARLDLVGRPILIAVSGGLDSVTLAYTLHELSDFYRLKLSIAHVNHGLRGDESEADEAAVRKLAAEFGVPILVARVDPLSLRRDRPSRDRPSHQEAARTVRYRALRELARSGGCERIATGHQADDQAETVLLRLLRGTGPDGLGGIPERSSDGVVVRPLLHVPRVEIESFARVRQLTWRDDSSNDRLGYARNRLRRRWLPGLTRDFNPRLLRAIGDLAEAQRRDTEWIAAQMEREANARFLPEKEWLRIDLTNWSVLPEALARRLAREALARAGGARLVSRVHLERVLAYLRDSRPGTRLELPGGLRLERRGRVARLGPLRGRGSNAAARGVEP
jgi:tRNA(Ile)-lysidine synthase